MYEELKKALRSLAKQPALTANVTLVLTLGIGASTAIFGVVDGVLLRPAHFADVDRLMLIWETDRASDTTREPASVPDYVDFKERASQFAGIAAFSGLDLNLTPDDGDAARVSALAVTHEFLEVVGVAPLLGRGFTPAEDSPGGPAAALISEGLWERSFARNPAVLGATLRIDDVPRTIVGVLGQHADFGMVQIHAASALRRGFGSGNVDVWVPMQPDPASSARANHGMFMIGRLATEASAASAQQEAAAIMADLERLYPQNDARGANVEPLEQVVFAPVRPALVVLLGAASFLLLVACANVASSLLVRANARAREIAIRSALGAGARRLTRQFLAESAVLTLAGAAGGVVLAHVALNALLALAPVDIPRIADVSIDGRVLGAALAVSVFICLAFGLLPTLQARRLDLSKVLHGSSRSASASAERRRLTAGVVVAQLALAVMLVIGAVLLITTLWRLQQVNPGFETAGVLKAEYQLPASRYPQSFANFPNWPEIRGFNDELLARIRGLPGVDAVALAGAHPLDAGFTSSIRVPGREAEAQDWPEPAVRSVSADYFRTVGLAVLAGDVFGSSAGAAAPAVVLINDAARQRYFGGEDAIGQRINLMGSDRTVIGVVGNETIHGVAAGAPPALYAPLAQVPSFIGRHSVHVRASGDVDALATELRRIIRELDPSLPLYGVEMLTDTLSRSLSQQRFMMSVLCVFAAVALALAILGVYGVASYSVARRTREIGIRIALGADFASVRRLVLRYGAVLTICGIGLGLVGALALRNVLVSFLYGVEPGDPMTFAGVAAVLAAVSLLAAYLPARRAARVDPMLVMRDD